MKAVRQFVVIRNNTATVDQNQHLLVRFPNLGGGGGERRHSPRERAVGFHNLADLDRRQSNIGPEYRPRDSEEDHNPNQWQRGHVDRR